MTQCSCSWLQSSVTPGEVRILTSIQSSGLPAESTKSNASIQSRGSIDNAILLREQEA
ncbi:rCG57069 [Rattus norvegicus]|uniref:RCG57069 n=1 Tax=Rattus norvegicus TaxID=10116 RepID=A6JCU5_RAT|nr:rCG57069 [Rattus norvegicus]